MGNKDLVFKHQERAERLAELEKLKSELNNIVCKLGSILISENNEIIKIERAKATAVEERERKKEQAHAQEEERKDLIFEENQARAEQEQAQKQADLNLSKIARVTK